MKELDDKNKEIEVVSDQRKQIEDTVDKALNVEIDLRDQTEEIDVLNNRYRRALKDKVSVYDELVKAVKQLTDRNSTFMRNEIEICRLTNLSSITKKELEQKEKMAQELEEKINSHEKGKKMRAAADTQIKQKHEKI